MRIVFLTIDRYPKLIHRGGMELRAWQEYMSLVALGHEVHIVAVAPHDPLEEPLAAHAASITTIPDRVGKRGSLEWLLEKAFNRETLILRLPNVHGHRDAVRRALDRIKPDLVWAEEQLTGVLVPDGMPFILSHVDFFYRLMRVRSRYRKVRKPNTMTNAGLERFEYDLSRRARTTVVASETDAELFQQRGISASYIPVVGATLPAPDRSQLSSGRFFLFGTANTAMRAARQHLRTELWPALDPALQQDWHQVGNPPSQQSEGDPSWQWLAERFTVHGFVGDLGPLFQFGDASVMPYPIDASGHAKYSVVMGYGLVNIGYEPGFRSTPELVGGENCIAAKTTEELVAAMREYRADAKLRRRLAEASRATYEAKFSFEAQVKNFARVLAA